MLAPNTSAQFTSVIETEAKRKPGNQKGEATKTFENQNGGKTVLRLPVYAFFYGFASIAQTAKRVENPAELNPNTVTDICSEGYLKLHRHCILGYTQPA